MSSKAVECVPAILVFIPDHFKTQVMCEKAIGDNAFELEFVPDQYKTEKMYNKVVESEREMLQFIHDNFETQEMHVLNQCKRQQMCEMVALEDPRMLHFIPDVLTTKRCIEKLLMIML